MSPVNLRQPPTEDKQRPDQRLEPTWRSELSQRLFDLLNAGEGDSAEFEEAVPPLVEEYGDDAYSELLFLLSHLTFEPGEAKDHWHRIVEHRARMATAMQSTVDLRVAMVSYLVDIHDMLASPAMIELQSLENARNFAFRDSLTGLYNFRFYREFLPREIWRADQYNAPLSLVVADIDDFKGYNDRHGHDEGNAALARIAVLLEESLRKVDVAVRYGGEEFVLILPSTPKTGAVVVAERAAQAIARAEMHRGERLTLSMGIATYPADAKNEGDLLHHADGAMYLAKAKGKNQIELHGNDRRSYSRARAALKGEFRQLSREAHAMETVNVGGGGLSFKSDRAMTLGSLVDVDLLISDGDESIHLGGRVVDTREVAPDRYEVSVKIVEIGAKDRWQLALYLRQLSTATEQPPED